MIGIISKPGERASVLRNLTGGKGKSDDAWGGTKKCAVSSRKSFLTKRPTGYPKKKSRSLIDTLSKRTMSMEKICTETRGGGGYEPTICVD